MTDIISTIKEEMDIQVNKMGQISETIRALEYEFDQINEQYLLNLDQYLQLQTEELKTNPPKNLEITIKKASLLKPNLRELLQ